MILTPDNEYAVLLDTCVLAPMPLCDTLLRLAEEPSMYRPLWSEQILQEVGTVLVRNFHMKPEQRDRRLKFMRDYFPEACVEVPSGLADALTCMPHENDRHVLAAAIRGHANAIITLNERHFPEECLNQYDVLRQTPDEFLIHQFYLSPDLVLEKIDAQAITIRKDRLFIVGKLRENFHAPRFAELVAARS